MSAERVDSHAGRVLSRIENGHNTTAVRHEAYVMIRDGKVRQGSELATKMLNDLTGSWRKFGTIADSQLDVNYSPPKVSSKGK